MHCDSILISSVCVIFAEPIIVEVTFRNPLKVSLALSNLSLLWSFSQDDASKPEESPITNEEELAPGVGHQCRSHAFEKLIKDLMLSHLLFF